MNGNIVDGNVTLSGSGSSVALYNSASHVKRDPDREELDRADDGNAFSNLSVYEVGIRVGGSQVDGNFSFTGNSGACTPALLSDPDAR